MFKPTFRRKRSTDDFAEEIKTHLELEADEWKREGLSEEQARLKARRAFGNVRAAQERFYLRDRLLWLDNLLRDLGFALRQLRRSPGFAVTAVLVLALGIAANVIVFGVIQTMILQPLDVPHPDRVMTFAPHPRGYPVVAWLEVRDVRDSNTVFSAVAAQQMQVYGMEANGVTRPVWGNEVSGQFFEVMAIQPLLGRLLQRSDDDHPGASEVAVLSWPAWKAYFGSDHNIVGKTVRINKHPYTIVGVTPEGFYGTEKFLQPDIFLPMVNEVSLEGVDWLEDRHQKNVFPVVRIKDGIPYPQVQAELNTIAARIRQQNPKEEDDLGFWLAPPGLIGDFLGGPARRFMAGVMVLAGILLLAACANLGSLFAARTADRKREIAIRMALGSSRWRILRQVLIEAFLISIVGGLCAWGLSWITLTALAQWHPPSDYPIKFAVQPKPSLMLWAFAVSIFSGIFFGVMPLRQIFQSDPNDAIKGGGNLTSPGRSPRTGPGRDSARSWGWHSIRHWIQALTGSWTRGWALRDFLLAAQIALCCITITAAFVSLRGLNKSLIIDRGFNPNHAVLTKFELSQAGYSREAAEHFQRRLVDTITQLPGVVSVGYADGTPLAETASSAVYPQETTDFKPSNSIFDTYYYDVSPGYLAAAETPLLEGRGILSTDTATTPSVAVVNERFAQHLFKTDHAVGRYFKDQKGHSIQIVGIVTTGKYFLLSEDPEEAAYFPILQKPSTATTLIVRARSSTSGVEAVDMAATVRKTIRDLDPAIPLRISGTWTDSLAFNLFPTQVATISLSIFGAFGLLLSITGTFGLASYTVSNRLRELSIRVALGAQARQILSAALGRMLVLLATGSVVGLLLGMAASRVLASIVFQASAQDPLVLCAVAFTMVLIGALSVANPVRRALRVEPSKLLREQ